MKTKNPRPATPATQSAIADDILRAIRRILRKTAEHSRQLASDGDLSVPQLLCLRCVADAPRKYPATVAGVADSVQLSKATVSRIFDRLEQAGLVSRTRSASDRRKVFVSLTALGRKKVRQLPPLLHEEFLAKLRRLNQSEQRKLLSALEQIVDMMGAASLDAAPLLAPETEFSQD
jgi:DNA-binding MarR family transcriptional regulator